MIREFILNIHLLLFLIKQYSYINCYLSFFHIDRSDVDVLINITFKLFFLILYDAACLPVELFIVTYTPLFRLIDCILFNIRPQECFNHSNGTIAYEGLQKCIPLLGTCGLWAWRDLYHVTPPKDRYTWSPLTTRKGHWSHIRGNEDIYQPKQLTHTCTSVSELLYSR